MESKEETNLSNKQTEIDSLSTKRDASWPSVLFYIHLNILGLYGIAVLATTTSFLTIIFTIFLCICSVFGITAGCHRLWAHQSYKANSYLRILLMIFQTMAGNGSIYNWVQIHRFHHQTYKTEDDIFYSYKDFTSAQVFAQLRNYSPKQQALLKKIDMSDLEADKIVMFQKRLYWLLYIIFCVLLPINTPLEYWNDTYLASIFVTFSLRYLIVLNISWLLNSAHFIWGLDKNNKPSDSNMIFIVTKTYWPYYHYLFPYDYQTGEFGDYATDSTTVFIRVFAALGWATDLKTITSDAVKKGLIDSVDNGLSVVDCINNAAQDEMENMPQEHYLNKSKFL